MNTQAEAQKKLISGLKKAEKFMKENKTESIEIVAKRLGMNSKDIGNLWGNYSFNVNIDSNIVNSLEKEGKWAKKAGVVNQEAKEPDYELLVYEGYINGLK